MQDLLLGLIVAEGSAAKEHLVEDDSARPRVHL